MSSINDILPPDVTLSEWETLAEEVGFSRRFARATTRVTVERVVEEARGLVGRAQHDNETAKTVLEGIHARASCAGAAQGQIS
jgi:hypothetical protein